ncbi:MAG: 4Fe-4S dicluster domain-containing protein [Candidatus Marinimicrobia bacterium]|nr:4Fe-4S dicluster domain-containing protein [Candidatus Neomarinimicrobiota bacterium]
MSTLHFERQIKYESELDSQFPKEIMEIPGGEHLATCIQCGTCSGACPLSIYMDHSPRKIIAMTRAGFKDDVLDSRTIWLCASCYSCTVECPKQIKITDTMYALKRKAIKENRYPKGFPVPVLAREFFGIVKKTGRNNERNLLLKLYLKTNVLRLFKQIPIGLKLFFKGRLGLKSEKIKKTKQLQTLLDAVERRTS